MRICVKAISTDFLNQAPSWYKGSLKGLKRTIAEKVKARYPDIEVTEAAID